MKLSRFLLLALVPAMLALVSGSAFAQDAPSSQFGIHAGTNGFGLQYAISPSIHVGGTLSLVLGDEPTSVGINPYARFLLEGTVNPYIEAGALISMNENTVTDDTETTTSLYAALGLEYFPNENVGLHAGVGILDLFLDPSATVFGLSAQGRAGVEWFFDR